MTRQERELYTVETAEGARRARVSGTLRQRAESANHRVIVGDWVDLTAGDTGDSTIVGRYERLGTIQRKVTGEITQRQEIAANVDLLFVVCSLNRELNLRRIERYLTGIWTSGARPAVVLNKMDLCEDVAAARAEVESVAGAVPVLTMSAQRELGLDGLRDMLGTGVTGLLVGSSGVGKSSITNRLLGEEVLSAREVREDDDKGRHTTTSRMLLVLPGGGLLIDTPGMREFQLWDGDLGSFEDIAELADACRFRDCAHQGELGCAVEAAVRSETLGSARLESYRKLQRELRRVEARKDDQARREEKAKVKQFGKMYKDVVQRKRDRWKS